MFGISKEKLLEFPEVKYPGKVILIDDPMKAKNALRYLNHVAQVGFDTETRPSFQKFRHYNVSLAQISCEDECFLFRLQKIGSLDGFMQFLENPEVQKIGLSLRDDFHQLAKLQEFNPQGFVDLQTFVKDYDIADMSLQKIFGIIFERRISKHQRLTNWEAEKLTEHQQHYAAIDAWACQQIYNHLLAGGFDREHCPYVLPDPVHDPTEHTEVAEPAESAKDSANSAEAKAKQAQIAKPTAAKTPRKKKAATPTQVKPEAKTAAKSKPEAKTAAKSKPEAKTAAKPKPKAKTAAKSKPEAKTKAKAKAEANSKAKAKSGTKSATKPTSKAKAKSEPKATSKSESKRKPKLTSESSK